LKVGSRQILGPPRSAKFGGRKTSILKNDMQKNFILILSFLLPMIMVFGQGAELKFQIKGTPEGTAKLAYYYGNKQYIKDSTKIDATGSFVFSSEEKYDEGIYLVVLPPNSKYFEVIMDKEQKWTISAENSDFVLSRKVKGSEENSVFTEYLKGLEEKKLAIVAPSKIKRHYESDTTEVNQSYKEKPAYKNALEEMQRINQEVADFKEGFVVKYPTAFISKVITVSKEPEVPDEIGAADSETKDLVRWLYFRDRYWDNIDLDDDRLLRTPVMHGKMEKYMTQLVVQIPDSINLMADKLMAKTTDLSEIQKYFIIWITNHYETSKQMGMDAVFVHMAKNYYMSGKAYWADSSLIAKISERATKLDPVLLGKVAPNLLMKDTLGNMHSLHGIKADFTIAYFWDPDCGHCKKETPKLAKFYDKFKDELGVEVFGVNTTKEEQLWKDFINEHGLNFLNVQDPEQRTAFKYRYDIYSTPVVYLLDKDKKIIAKRLGVDDIEGFIRSWKERKE
jgi:peroxiredoxin